MKWLRRVNFSLSLICVNLNKADRDRALPMPATPFIKTYAVV